MPVDAPLYPVNLIVAGRRCLVVGGGAIAARKVEGLLDCGAVVHVVASRVGHELRSRADESPELTYEQRPYRAGEVAGYRLAMAATDDGAVNAQVSADGEAVGIWVNSADDPAHCSFTLPSVTRRGPISVAVSTGGHSPALAAWLRDTVQAWLGPEFEVAVRLLSEERDAIRDAGRSTEGLAWRQALESDMLDLIRAGQVQQAKERLQACLSSSSV